MTPKVQMICEKCGSTQVLRDAWAEWDVESQEWVLQNVFDHAVCESDVCNGAETAIDEVPVEEAERTSYLDEEP